MEDLAAVVAADRAADLAPLAGFSGGCGLFSGWVSWWVLIDFEFGWFLGFCWFWVGLIFGFLLILGWVDFWVSVDFGICFCARLRCLVVALGLVVRFVGVWWWRRRWRWRLDMRGRTQEGEGSWEWERHWCAQWEEREKKERNEDTHYCTYNIILSSKPATVPL